MKKVFRFILFLAFFIFWCSTPLFSRNFSSQKFKKTSSHKIVTCDVEAQQRVQRRWNGNFCITNWGFFGSQTRYLYESVGCLFCDHPDDPNYPAESFEFPSGTGLEYLFQGSLWIGGIVNEETLVTVGCDGWQWIYEMAPEAGPGGNITESDGPLGDQECIAVYYDTAVPPPLTFWPDSMDWDRREHIPLNLKITQHSYSWEIPDYDDFVILEFWLKNIGSDSIEKSYIGFFMDTDILRLWWSPY